MLQQAWPVDRVLSRQGPGMGSRDERALPRSDTRPRRSRLCNLPARVVEATGGNAPHAGALEDCGGIRRMEEGHPEGRCRDRSLIRMRSEIGDLLSYVD